MIGGIIEIAGDGRYLYAGGFMIIRRRDNIDFPVVTAKERKAEPGYGEVGRWRLAADQEMCSSRNVAGVVNIIIRRLADQEIRSSRNS